MKKAMLEVLQGKEVTIYFVDGSNATKGVLETVSENFVKYRTDFEEFYIPISSICSISLDTKTRERAKVGFTQ
ncbi:MULTISPECIES: hypothetical protein [Paenibacillus]|nr:hypothetical protein [Paenibacillus odorifer]